MGAIERFKVNKPYVLGGLAGYSTSHPYNSTVFLMWGDGGHTLGGGLEVYLVAGVLR